MDYLEKLIFEYQRYMNYNFWKIKKALCKHNIFLNKESLLNRLKKNKNGTSL